MEHHHGFDFMPDQFRAMCKCGEMRINPTYNPTITKGTYFAYYCGCGEHMSTSSSVEYTTFAELHSHCKRSTPSQGVHMHIPSPKRNWLKRLLRR